MMNSVPLAVTMISSYLPMKGISPYTVALTNPLSELVDLQLITFASLYPEFLYPGKTKDSKCRVEAVNFDVVPLLKWYNPFTWISAGFLARGKIIHLQWWSYILAPQYITVALIAKLRRKIVVTTIHNVKPHDSNVIKRFMNGLVTRLSDQIIVHTESGAKELLKANKQPIHVIPHPILNGFDFPIGKSEARNNLGINDSEKVILFFGNIRQYKGLSTLLYALRQSRKDERYHLLIVGQCWDDWSEYESVVAEISDKHRVTVNAEFVPQSAVGEYFSATDLVVLPYTHFDGMSGVGTLCVNYEVPLLTSDLAGIREYVPDATFTFGPKNYEQLATCIRNFFSSREMSVKAINHFRILAEENSPTSVARKTYALYSQIA